MGQILADALTNVLTMQVDNCHDCENAKLNDGSFMCQRHALCQRATELLIDQGMFDEKSEVYCTECGVTTDRPAEERWRFFGVGDGGWKCFACKGEKK